MPWTTGWKAGSVPIPGREGPDSQRAHDKAIHLITEDVGHVPKSSEAGNAPLSRVSLDLPTDPTQSIPEAG